MGVEASHIIEIQLDSFALLNFRQVEPTHIMENIVYNHLRGIGYKVDIGCITKYNKNPEGKTEPGATVSRDGR